MPVVVGESANQFNTVNHVTNGEPAAQSVFRRPSVNLENRTNALKTFGDTLETRYIDHDHTGDGVNEPGQISRAGISGVNAANGICGLDSGGKVPVAQLPASIVGSLHFVGTWDASTNTPAIASGSAGAGNQGWYYLVSVAGTTTVDGETDWQVGDWIVSDGSSWEKIDNTDSPHLADIAALSLSGKAGWTLGVDNAGTNLTLIDTPTRNAAVDAELATHDGEIATLQSNMTAAQTSINAILTNVAKEQSFTVTNPSGQSVFTLTQFTVDPDNSVVDDHPVHRNAAARCRGDGLPSGDVDGWGRRGLH